MGFETFRTSFLNVLLVQKRSTKRLVGRKEGGRGSGHLHLAHLTRSVERFVRFFVPPRGQRFPSFFPSTLPPLSRDEQPDKQQRLPLLTTIIEIFTYLLIGNQWLYTVRACPCFSRPAALFSFLIPRSSGNNFFFPPSPYNFPPQNFLTF